MVQFIESHRAQYGVESICGELPIAPSVSYEQRARGIDPARRPARGSAMNSCAPRSSASGRKTSRSMAPEKVWIQMHREGLSVARCTAERLMRQMGLRGVLRGRGYKATTVADPTAAR